MALKIGYKQLLEEANGIVSAVSVEDAAGFIDDENTVFVDIRDVRELDRDGTIPSAFHAPRGMLEFWVDPDCKYHKRVFSSGKALILFCNSGWRSALAAKCLQEMGLESVSHLSGGYEEWKKAALPTVQREGRSR